LCMCGFVQSVYLVTGQFHQTEGLCENSSCGFSQHSLSPSAGKRSPKIFSDLSRTLENEKKKTPAAPSNKNTKWERFVATPPPPPRTAHQRTLSTQRTSERARRRDARDTKCLRSTEREREREHTRIRVSARDSHGLAQEQTYRRWWISAGSGDDLWRMQWGDRWPGERAEAQCPVQVQDLPLSGACVEVLLERLCSERGRVHVQHLPRIPKRFQRQEWRASLFACQHEGRLRTLVRWCAWFGVQFLQFFFFASLLLLLLLLLGCDDHSCARPIVHLSGGVCSRTGYQLYVGCTTLSGESCQHSEFY
jgi:hypothetical protein